MPEYNENVHEEYTVTKEKIDALIEASTKEFSFFDNSMTVAVVRLPCGYKLVDQSSCVDPELFDKEKGKKYALQKIHRQLWELEIYRAAQDKYRKLQESYQGGF